MGIYIFVLISMLIVGRIGRRLWKVILAMKFSHIRSDLAAVESETDKDRKLDGLTKIVSRLLKELEDRERDIERAANKMRDSSGF